MSKNENFFAPRYWPVWLALGLLRLLINLPYKTLLKIGAGIGRLLLLFPSKMRRTSEVNLRLCFPELSEQERQQLLRKSFESIGIGIIETALGWWAPDEKIKPLARVQGLEHAQKALTQGKGALLCGPHFTSLELVGRLFTFYLPIAVMYREQKNPLLAKINRDALNKHYVRVLQRENIRGMVRALKDNLAVYYAPDIDAGENNSVFAPFFGVMAASITATSRYAKISGAAAIPAGFYRREDGSGYDIIVQPPLENFPSDNIEADVQRVNQAVEALIRKKPEQYLWQYKRFKTRPNGEKRFY